MKSKRKGKRYPLLVYRRFWDRLWAYTLVLSLLMGAWWFWSGRGLFPSLQPPYDVIVFAGAMACFFFTVISLFLRNMAYVRVYEDHFRVVTPFLRLKISYKRIKTTHPSQFTKFFPPEKMSWAQRHFLEPFFAKTAVGVELNGFPLSPGLLHLFLGPQMFLPYGTGLVFVIDQWMELTTEMDSLRSRVQQQRGGQERTGYGILRNINKK